MQLAQLFFVHVVGRLRHQVGRALRFRESNNVADRIALSHNHNQTVKTESQTSVRRSAVFEGIHHKAKFFLRFLVG